MQKKELIECILLATGVVGGMLYVLITGTLTVRGPVIQETLAGFDPVAVSGTVMISPYDAKDEVLEYMIGANYSLDGWFYQITDTAIIQALDLNAQTGVETNLIVERSTYGNNTKTYTNLVKKLEPNSRIQIKSDDHLGVVYNHTKAFIRDDMDVLIATANLSYPSFARNREYRVQVDDASVVDSVRLMFDADREGNAIDPSTIHASLLVCPINCRSGLDSLLDDVEQSLGMQAQYIEDDRVIERLHELTNAGVEVRLLVGEFQDEEKLTGLEYRIQRNFYNHSKALLIDEEKLLIGSMNYSTNSIENNREISVLLNNPQSLGLFSWQFDKDWEESAVTQSEAKSLIH